ncbi:MULTISPECIES: hypothetical protein [unclassified Modestobacter]|uniref:hypothetical protein n=1 Tax=unclassified Modestobacter TaxID=2643866 RepID=UPI0022AB33FF|nr:MULTISPECIES: hypothetical protein [unclassified Modestobacter]MCZ2823280.1 hypothetical protein [Modestobacter sp. VKM Ac-2981]MCZ2851525.1 hypothetical protein [Modestobacter sp. VKM Ac-2982]
MPSDAETPTPPLQEALDALNAARLAVLKVNLSAPTRVAALMVDVYVGLQADYRRMEHAFEGQQLEERLEAPPFPATLWTTCELPSGVILVLGG